MATDDRASFQRLQRLKATLRTRIENPAAVLETLLALLVGGETQSKLWEDLHAAAARDGVEQALAAAYVKVASSPRMHKLETSVQIEVLMHAADFFQGILGDASTAENFLGRVQHLAPSHREAFERLERRLESQRDPRRLLDLYAVAASAQPTSKILATKAASKLTLLPATTPLGDETCRGLVPLVPAAPRLLDLLDTHCRATKRPQLAAAVIEAALLDPLLSDEVSLKHRRRLVELYVGDAKSPASSIGHVEALLNDDPSDRVARRAAESLLSVPAVAKRAAAILQSVRRWVRTAERRKQ